MNYYKLIAIFYFFTALSIGLSAQCVSGDCNNGTGIYIYPDGTRYSGQFSEGMPSGTGICMYANGSKYQGEWYKGRPHGRGTLTYSDHRQRNGYWRNGKASNEVVSSPGTRPTVTTASNQRTGCLRGNCHTGTGLYKFVDGSQYEGVFMNGRPHGQGIYRYANGNVYTGNFARGLRSGQGRMQYVNGRSEAGIWKNDNYLGRQTSSRNTVAGCQAGDCENGYGEFRFKDGVKYTGTFRNSLPDGRGEVVYPNGERYTGQLRKGAFQGRGSFFRANNKVLRGFWDNSEYLGDDPKLQSQTIVAETQTVRRSDAIPKIWAVVVGIASYTHMPALRFTDDDAYRMMAFLKSPKGGALPDNQIRVLIDEDATKHRIKDTMTEIFGKAGPNDMILLYFSGHGLKGSFLPSNYDGYRNKLMHEEVAAIFNNSRAKYKLCIADACHSGSLLTSRDGYEASAYASYYDKLKSAKAGSALIMSSKSEETSLESSGLRQGVFSHFLIRGLKGEANFDNDEVVTVQELFKFVKDNVSSYTKGRQSPMIEGDYDKKMPVSAGRL